MSLEILLGHDTVSFAHPVTAQDAMGGMTVTYPTNYADGVAGRVEDLSATEKSVYQAQNLMVTHRVIGKTDGVENGDRIETSDGRFIMVKTIQKRRAIGNMPTFFVYVGEEWRPGA